MGHSIIILKKFLTFMLYFVVICVVAYIVFALVTHPSLDRDWNRDQKVLATTTFSGDLITVKNIRNINYRSTTDYDIRYYDKTFDIKNLESVWYLVEPFAGTGAGAAHTLVSFGFKNGDYLAVSAEIRKQKGESFSAVNGLFRSYEIVYVVADEKDVIKLRSNYRKDDVFLYPVHTSKEKMQKLFISMLTRANKLATEPEFYNTLTNTCATNIVEHVNEIVPGRIPWSYKVLMPAYSDELAHNLGLIGEGMTIDEMRVKYRINEKAEKYADDPEWSKRIRD